MTEPVRPSFHGFEQIPLREYAERAYLDYSMYVVLDRALPFLGDGLKPVQRRIIYAMSELGLNAGAKPKKSARTIGDVIGKFHPHGDSACYEALVLMAQPFSYRYPLIEGQGNFGSTDDPIVVRGDALHRIQADADRRSPAGRTRPGHRRLEPELRRHPGRTELAAGAPAAPAAQRHHRHRGRHGHRRAAAQPQRSRQRLRAPARRSRRQRARPVRARARPGLSDHGRDHHPGQPTCWRCTKPAAAACAPARPSCAKAQNLVITALPYQVSPSKIMEQIATQMRAKKLPWLEDLRDESDHAERRCAWCWCRAPTASMSEALMGHLFATTDLEKSFRVNMNIIGLDGRPQVKNLKTLLAEWLAFRLETVRKRLQPPPGKSRAPPAPARRPAGRVPQPG